MAVLEGTQSLFYYEKVVLLRLKQKCFINLSDTVTNKTSKGLNEPNYLTVVNVWWGRCICLAIRILRFIKDKSEDLSMCEPLARDRTGANTLCVPVRRTGAHCVDSTTLTMACRRYAAVVATTAAHLRSATP